jgi:hypothetical protein
MKQHFFLERHAVNSCVYCAYCDKKFKGARSGGLIVHRFILPFFMYIFSTFPAVLQVINIHLCRKLKHRETFGPARLKDQSPLEVNLNLPAIKGFAPIALV